MQAKQEQCHVVLLYLEVDFLVVSIQESLTGSKERWYDCQFPAARLTRAVNALPSGLSFHQDCQLRACTYYSGMDLLWHKNQCISSATLPICVKSKTHSQDPQASFSRTDHSRGTAYFLSKRCLQSSLANLMHPGSLTDLLLRKVHLERAC